MDESNAKKNIIGAATKSLKEKANMYEQMIEDAKQEQGIAKKNMKSTLNNFEHHRTHKRDIMDPHKI
jgi:hypothetical protein